MTQRSWFPMSSERSALRCGLGFIVLIAASASTAGSDISFVDIFKNNESLQTANGNSLSYAGSFFSADLFSVSANDYLSAQITAGPTSVPVNLPQVDSTTFHYQTSFFSSQSAMDTAFPFGTYTFAAYNGTTTDTTSFSYTTDYYPQSQPYFAGTTYSALQGMNTAAPFTFQLSPFTTGSLPSGSTSYIFLTVYNLTTGTTAFSQGFLPANTPSVAMPANALTPGDSYEAQLIFDNRIYLPSPGAAFDAEIGYDLRADAFFTAASVPEPATLVLFAPACVFVVCVARRRRAK
jgi:hypothetical protein